MDINKNMQYTVDYIYQNIITQWDDIKNNIDIMNVLDIDDNNMCKYYKSINPDLDNTQIQAQSLTLLFSMMILISTPITADNEMDYMIEVD